MQGFFEFMIKCIDWIHYLWNWIFVVYQNKCIGRFITQVMHRKMLNHSQMSFTKYNPKHNPYVHAMTYQKTKRKGLTIFIQMFNVLYNILSLMYDSILGCILFIMSTKYAFIFYFCRSEIINVLQLIITCTSHSSYFLQFCKLFMA